MSTMANEERFMQSYDSARQSAYIHELRRELFHMWGFLAQEGLWDEALEFMDDHKDVPVPFGFDL